MAGTLQTDERAGGIWTGRGRGVKRERRGKPGAGLDDYVGSTACVRHSSDEGRDHAGPIIQYDLTRPERRPP